ncbi:MAG: four helix bundle protein [Candidatus Uhrbacteria bacterium]|nr:four helix bundle protein [Candidatus Uhrbacteria bacterium]
MDDKIISFRDLSVWQKSMDLSVLIYKITDNFPKHEIYGLTSQMRRSSSAIPCNIAEGRMRGTRKEYARFVNIAFSSGVELETQIELARRLKYLTDQEAEQLVDLVTEIMKMLNGLQGSLRD